MKGKKMKTIVPCKKCDQHPCVCCACGGFMNDWHSHASDCIEVNSKGGKDYRSKNDIIANDIRDLCESIKENIQEGIGPQEIMECVRQIKSMTWYIKE